jgi:hypothetical protein
MKPKLSKLAVIAAMSAAFVPSSAMAMVNGNEGPGGHSSALVCGKDYSRNSVGGDYCVRRGAPVSAPAQTSAPATPQPTQIVVKHNGFAWGDALAGAGAALAIVLTGGGATALRRHRRGGPQGPVRGSAVTG